MSGPFVLSSLEEHLIEHHGIDLALISQTRDLHGNPDEVAERSHELMHALGYANHTHDDE